MEMRAFHESLGEAMVMSDGELDAAIRADEIVVRALHARRAALLAAAEARALHRADGHHTLSGYLRAALNGAPGVVARLRTVATVCNRVPALGEALAAGYVGSCQIEQIARIHTNPRTREFLPVVAPIYLERAEYLSYADLRREIDQFLLFADTDGAFADLAERLEHRTARVSAIDGEVDICASGGDPLTATRVVAIFESFVQREFERDLACRREQCGDAADGEPLPRTAAQRRFDALIAIFETAATAPSESGVEASSQRIGGTSIDTTVNVIVDARTLDEAFVRHGLLPDEIDTLDDAQLADTLDGFASATVTDPTDLVDRRCETSSGVAVHPDLALRAALAGHVRRVVIDSSGLVTDFGRRQRLFTGPARAAAKLLIRSCDHFGCQVSSRHADVDHLDEWWSGGATDLANAGIRCRSHNRFKHRSRRRTERDPDGLRFDVRADGTIVLPAGARSGGRMGDRH